MITPLLSRGNDEGAYMYLPPSDTQIKEAFAELDSISEDSAAPIRIMEVQSNVYNLHSYIKSIDIEAPGVLDKLGALAQKLQTMSRDDCLKFEGVLDANSVNGIDDVLRLSESLDDYAVISDTGTSSALGKYLVEHGVGGFPESVKPYLDYQIIGEEFYADHGGAFCRGGYVVRKDELPEQLVESKRESNSRYCMRMIKDELERDRILTVKGGTEWSIASITNILRNEKYCGDALQQKTFIADCISGKAIRNTGQLPMYLIQDHHEGIVSRDTFNAVQAELARRNAGKAPSKKSAPTGRSCYTSKYALSDRLVCGDCGTLYRRCVWTHHGMKRIVWRCISRIDYGTKYCKQSPTIDEAPLQAAILSAINSMMDRKEQIIDQLAGAMYLELAPVPGESMSIADLDRAIADRTQHFNELFAACQGVSFMERADEFRQITEDIATLKEKRARLLEQQKSDSAAARRTGDAISFLDNASAELIEWKESDIRQLVDSVKVVSENRICVTLRCGVEIERELIK